MFQIVLNAPLSWIHKELQKWIQGYLDLFGFLAHLIDISMPSKDTSYSSDYLFVKSQMPNLPSVIIQIDKHTLFSGL